MRHPWAGLKRWREDADPVLPARAAHWGNWNNQDNRHHVVWRRMPAPTDHEASAGVEDSRPAAPAAGCVSGAASRSSMITR